MADKFKFRRVNEITGVFVIIVVVLVCAAVVLTARSQRWFKSNVTLRIVLPEAGAAGIRQGSEVYFLGTLVGAVSDVLVDPTGRMEAHTRLRRDFFLFIRADSSAVVKKKFGVAGDAFFEITRGEGKPLPEQNAYIVCNEAFQSGLELAIEDIRSQAASALTNAAIGIDTWTRLGAELRQTRDKLDLAADRWNTLAEGLANGRGTIGKLLNETALADETLATITNARLALAETRAILTNLHITTLDIQTGATRLPEIAASLADGLKDLPKVTAQTELSMRELERLVVAMQHHWLFRKYVGKTNAPAGKPAFTPRAVRSKK